MELLFGIHCHQPVNNFYEIVEEATEKSYYPFLKTLLDYKNLKISVHFSGWLLKWIKEYNKKTFNILKKLSDNGQIEFFTAGFYEPILSIIPEKDAELQILKLNKFIYNNFGQTAKGLWLTERVWEDKIIKLLVNCGIDYVIVDDYHFISSGFSKNSLQGYFITESEGNSLGIFPINKELRYIIPFESVDKILNSLKKLSCGIIFDDGEKFGLWPKTFEWVYEKEWLKNFFETISLSEHIKTTTFSEFYSNNTPLSRVYLPEVSYYEMGEWSLGYNKARELQDFIETHNLGTTEIETFLKGGIWKNFLIKYEESNNIHKRFTQLSKLIKNKSLSNEVTDYLLQSQCNDCLWHGVFGGIYLPNLRDNSYIAINKAEKLLDSKSETAFDINIDGFTELFHKSKKITAAISSKFYGALFEFSDRDSCFNLLNTLTRRKELYHDEILKKKVAKAKTKEVKTIHNLEYEVSDEIKKELIFDKHLKYSFIDKIIPKTSSFENYKLNTLEVLSNFHNSAFKFNKKDYSFSNSNFINLFNKNFPVLIRKNYFLKDNILESKIVITNESFLYFDLNYLIELNFFFPGHTSENSFIEYNNSKNPVESNINVSNIKLFKIFDNVVNKYLIISSEQNFTLWSYPFYSVSKSEKSFDKIYQGTTFGLTFPFDFKPNEQREYIIKIKLGD